MRGGGGPGARPALTGPPGPSTAMWSMARLNRTGARLMHKYGVHGATDVTGFGLLGHARNLASHQRAAVDLVIDTLPGARPPRGPGLRAPVASCLGGFYVLF